MHALTVTAEEQTQDVVLQRSQGLGRLPSEEMRAQPSCVAMTLRENAFMVLSKGLQETVWKIMYYWLDFLS